MAVADHYLTYCKGVIESISPIEHINTIIKDKNLREVSVNGNIIKKLTFNGQFSNNFPITEFYLSDIPYKESVKHSLEINDITWENKLQIPDSLSFCLFTKDNATYKYIGGYGIDLTSLKGQVFKCTTPEFPTDKNTISLVQIGDNTIAFLHCYINSEFSYIIVKDENVAPQAPDINQNNIQAIDSSNVLEILKLWDSEGDEYIMNEQNVYQINPLTLYLPNVKEGTIVYVEYKTMPPQLVFKGGNSSTFPLPPELYKLLYALVALKVVRSIDDFKSMEGAILNNYALELQQAMNSNWALSNEMESTLQFKKGFY
jgi:hypothetical protein|nr:MAG TPA: hypothetical protein [Caudoviricetes sp.]